ncbi:MAG: N-acetyltransferase family protein [Aeromicrobium sp.]
MNADVSARLTWTSDASAIAQIQIAAWRQDYSDVLPSEVLLGLKAEQFAEQWEALLTKPQDARMRVLVALERATVRGFALLHPSQDPDADPVADSEVGEFVIDPLHRRAGHGSRLLQASIDTLQADKFTRALWWVAANDDILRGFVTASGWEPDGAHRELQSEAGTTLKQIRLHTSLS